MRTRSALVPTLCLIASAVVLPMKAQAATVRTDELVDRRLFDATPQRTPAALHLDGLTAGPLGGALDLTVTAADGTLPTAPGSCERALVTGILTLSPGELVTISAKGEACAHIVDGSLQVNAFLRNKNVDYTGTQHKRGRLIGDGLIAASQSFLGGLATFSGVFRWRDSEPPGN